MFRKLIFFVLSITSVNAMIYDYSNWIVLNQEISLPEDNDAKEPQLAINHKTGVAVCSYRQSNSLKVLFSNDNGKTWTYSTTLSDNAYSSIGLLSNFDNFSVPSLQFDSARNVAIIIWRDFTSNNILGACSSDGGVTWVNNGVIGYAKSGSYSQGIDRPSVIPYLEINETDGYAICIWETDNGGQENTTQAVKLQAAVGIIENGSVTWHPPETIFTSFIGNYLFPTITINPATSRIFATWKIQSFYRNDVFVSYKDGIDNPWADNINTLLPGTKTTQSWSNPACYVLAKSYFGTSLQNNGFICVQDGAIVRSKYTPDGGESWYNSNPLILTTNQELRVSPIAAMNAINNQGMVLFQDIDANSNVRFKSMVTKDLGKNWTNAEFVTSVEEPVLTMNYALVYNTITNQALFVYLSNNELRSRYSDSRFKWSAAKTITNISSIYDLKMNRSNGNAIVVWQDNSYGIKKIKAAYVKPSKIQTYNSFPSSISSK